MILPVLKLSMNNTERNLLIRCVGRPEFIKVIRLYIYYITILKFILESPAAVSYTHLDVYKRQVQDRCGQCNELPPVLQFLSANKWGEAYSAYLLADKAVQGNRRIFGNLRKDDCLWKERRY